MKNILIILAATFALFACGGDDDGNGPAQIDPPTNQELATRSWRVVKVTANGDDISISGYSFRFEENGDFTINAPDVDDPDFPTSGSWEFNNSENKIILNGSAELDVVVLTENEFILEYSYQNFKNGTVLFRFEMEPA